MIYNTLTLANATLAMIEFLHCEDDTNLFVYAFRGCGENGYTLLGDEQENAVSFAQSASGDSLVVYCTPNRWVLKTMDYDAFDDLAEFFGCDDLFKAAKFIMEKLENSP